MRRKLSALEQEKDRLQHVTNLDEMLDMQVWFTRCFMIIFNAKKIYLFATIFIFEKVFFCICQNKRYNKKK